MIIKNPFEQSMKKDANNQNIQNGELKNIKQ